jgi:hypothetical protein
VHAKLCTFDGVNHHASYGPVSQLWFDTYYDSRLMASLGAIVLSCAHDNSLVFTSRNDCDDQSCLENTGGSYACIRIYAQEMLILDRTHRYVFYTSRGDVARDTLVNSRIL